AKNPESRTLTFPQFLKCLSLLSSQDRSQFTRIAKQVIGCGGPRALPSNSPVSTSKAPPMKPANAAKEPPKLTLQGYNSPQALVSTPERPVSIDGSPTSGGRTPRRASWSKRVLTLNEGAVPATSGGSYRTPMSSGNPRRISVGMMVKSGVPSTSSTPEIVGSSDRLASLQE
ncbi:hypothetical protein CYMTET_15336, partial [Cymbomonas tetramitiformis]